MEQSNIYLELDKTYLIMKKFLQWIEHTKLYIVKDCYKLILNNGFMRKYEIADLYFLEDSINVKTDENHFELVKRIFNDFSRETKIKVKLSLEKEGYYYY